MNFPRMPRCSCIEVGWGGRGAQRSLGSAPQQEGLLLQDWMVSMLMVHSKVQILVFLGLSMCVFISFWELCCNCYFWQCSCDSPSSLWFECMTLFWTLWQQSWSTSWTSWKTRIRKHLLPWAPIPLMILRTIFILTTSTHLVILMMKVCSALSACDKIKFKPILLG